MYAILEKPSNLLNVTLIRRKGIFYGEKDPKLEVDESVYSLTTRKGSMIIVN